jgi:hypothetical protein
MHRVSWLNILKRRSTHPFKPLANSPLPSSLCHVLGLLAPPNVLQPHAIVLGPSANPYHTMRGDTQPGSVNYDWQRQQSVKIWDYAYPVTHEMAAGVFVVEAKERRRRVLAMAVM